MIRMKNKGAFFLVLILLFVTAGFQIEFGVVFPFFINIYSFIESNFSGFVALLALIVSVFSVYASYLIFKRSGEKSVVEDFWLQSVILPNFLTPLVQFVEMLPDKLKQSENDIEAFYSDDSEWFIKQFDALLNKSKLLTAHSTALQTEIEDVIYDFEESFSLLRYENVTDLDLTAKNMALNLFLKINLLIKEDQLKRISIIQSI